ncbi:hypothetical protein GCM10011297_03500 [Bacterioplanes sanyensis]|nr:hypothetical protein GCM10011297_03500 [Bacterioplanes sanyensis]
MTASQAHVSLTPDFVVTAVRRDGHQVSHVRLHAWSGRTLGSGYTIRREELIQSLRRGDLVYAARPEQGEVQLLRKIVSIGIQGERFVKTSLDRQARDGLDELPDF